jgi:hypothetical protein
MASFLTRIALTLLIGGIGIAGLIAFTDYIVI